LGTGKSVPFPLFYEDNVYLAPAQEENWFHHGLPLFLKIAAVILIFALTTCTYYCSQLCDYIDESLLALVIVTMWKAL
jgi:hypothetical protein